MFASGAALDVGIEVNPPIVREYPQCAALKLHCHHDNENAAAVSRHGFHAIGRSPLPTFTDGVGLAD